MNPADDSTPVITVASPRQHRFPHFKRSPFIACRRLNYVMEGGSVVTLLLFVLWATLILNMFDPVQNCLDGLFSITSVTV